MTHRMLIRSIDHSFMLGQLEPALYHVRLEHADGMTGTSVTFATLPQGWDIGEPVLVDEHGQPVARQKPRLTLGGRLIVEESASSA